MNTPWKKNLLNIGMVLALTIFALWFALKDDYHSVLNSITKISWGWLAVISVTGILYYSIQGFILTLITRKFKKDSRFIDGIHNAFIAGFFNGVTPLGGGQVAQTYVLKKQGIKFSDCASILWIDFIIFQSVVLGLAGSLMLFHYSYIINNFSVFSLLILAGFAINSFVIVSLWTMCRFPKLYQKISCVIVRILSRLHLVKHGDQALQAWNRQLECFTKEIQAVRKEHKLIAVCAILNILRMLLFYAIPYLVALALGFPFDFEMLLHVLVISASIHMLNALTPLPGDTGWTESAFIIMFSQIFTRSTASSIMILWRAATYHIVLLIGGGMFLYVKSKKKTVCHTDEKETETIKHKKTDLSSNTAM